MDCSSYGHENSDGVKFCNECGMSLGASAENTTLPREPSVDSPESQVGSEQASSTSGLAGSTFVGRERELGELISALVDAMGGQSRLVMLVGEPGIGKTRTAHGLATHETLREVRVLCGRSYKSQIALSKGARSPKIHEDSLCW